MTDYLDINQKLEDGGVVLLPTETVYGLACSAVDQNAVEKIYAIKGRAFQKPLAVCVKDLATAQAFGSFSSTAVQLAKQYWPGSLTIIVEAKPDIQIDAKCQSQLNGMTTIAFRCPEASWLSKINGPLALTSANRSGEKDCTSFEAALEELGDEVAAALPADIALSGQPSTILSVIDDEITILRQGTLKVIL